MTKKLKSHFFFVNLFFASFYANLSLNIFLITIFDGYSYEYAWSRTVNSITMFSLYGGVFFLYFFSWLYIKCFSGLNNWLESKISHSWIRMSMIVFILAFVFATPFLLTQEASLTGFKKMIYFMGFFVAPGYIVTYFLHKYGMKRI